jgi:DNA (cytosine-5)-methyltransferase 1
MMSSSTDSGVKRKRANSPKRKYFRRRVATPDHTLKTSFKDDGTLKAARLSLRADTEKFHDVFINNVSATSLHPVDKIQVGTDCSGLGTELLALRLANINHVAVFGTELNEATRRIHCCLHGKDGTKLHFDIFKRPKPPTCDLYVVGPPCQSWSSMGKRAGLDDLAGRGLVCYSCLAYIRDQRPRAVVLENVVGLRNLHPGEFSDILNILANIGYKVTWDILDTRDSGLPQRRPRLYIVGIRSDSISYSFTFPQKMQVNPGIEKFLDTQTETQRRNLEVARKTVSSKGLQGTILVDLAASARFENIGVGISPCITATRAKQGCFFFFSMNQKRMTNTFEIGRLQGFPTWAVHKMLSTSAQPGGIRFAIGNAMGANVRVCLLPRVAYSAGLLKTKPKDTWEHFSSKTAAAPKALPGDVYDGADAG